MTRLDLVGAHRTLTAPLRAGRAIRKLARGGITNAHSALVEVQRAVQDRSALTEDLLGPVAPGHLRALDEPACWSLLASQEVGRLAFVARRETPEVLPVNYVVDGREVVVCSGVGPKLQAAQRHDRVAFEVDAFDRLDRSGWSVVVHGRAHVVPPGDHLASVPQPWATGSRHHVLRIVPERVTGRRLEGGAEPPSETRPRSERATRAVPGPARGRRG